jgi:hypothetical protein
MRLVFVETSVSPGFTRVVSVRACRQARPQARDRGLSRQHVLGTQRFIEARLAHRTLRADPAGAGVAAAAFRRNHQDVNARPAATAAVHAAYLRQSRTSGNGLLVPVDLVRALLLSRIPA